MPEPSSPPPDDPMVELVEKVIVGKSFFQRFRLHVRLANRPSPDPTTYYSQHEATKALLAAIKLPGDRGMVRDRLDGDVVSSAKVLDPPGNGRSDPLDPVDGVTADFFRRAEGEIRSFAATLGDEAAQEIASTGQSPNKAELSRRLLAAADAIRDTIELCEWEAR